MSSLRTENLVDVTMPQMGVSVAEGTVVAWRVEVGDRIEAEQTICEISTDKIDTEVPAPVTGIVAEILVEVDTTVEVGVVLARIATGDGGAAAVPREPSAPAVAEPTASAVPEADTPAAAPPAAAAPARPRPRWRRRRRRPRNPNPIGRPQAGGTPPSSSGSPPSTGSISTASRGRGGADACASRT